MRVKAAEAVTTLYKNKSWVANLSLFTTRFKKRMLALTLDKEGVVAEAGIDLLVELLRNGGHSP